MQRIGSVVFGGVPVGARCADRLAFGSDVTDLPVSMGLGPILLAPISVEAKRSILGLNALRLLARCDVGGLRLPVAPPGGGPV